VHYLDPSSLDWMDLELNYTDFLTFAFSGDLAKFYAAERWKSWKEDLGALEPTQGFSFYPFLWTEGPPLENRQRAAVPMKELFDIAQDLRGQLGKR
jgi:hypothetical protein